MLNHRIYLISFALHLFDNVCWIPIGCVFLYIQFHAKKEAIRVLLIYHMSPPFYCKPLRVVVLPFYII